MQKVIYSHSFLLNHFEVSQGIHYGFFFFRCTLWNNLFLLFRLVVMFWVIGQNVCPFWLVFLCGGGRSSCSSCMGGELEVGQNVCPEWPVRPCGTTVE